jgi:hypothetical protein
MTDKPDPILAPRWKQILLRAHSIRAMAAVVVLEGLNVAWPYVQGYIPVSELTLGLIAMALSMAAIYFRLSYQPGLSGPRNEQA